MGHSGATLLVGSCEPFSGKSALVMGLVQQLRDKGQTLRYGKPLIVDYLSIELDEAAIKETFDKVMPGLLGLMLNKKILEEDNYKQLIREGDDPDCARRRAPAPPRPRACVRACPPALSAAAARAAPPPPPPTALAADACARAPTRRRARRVEAAQPRVLPPDLRLEARQAARLDLR